MSASKAADILGLNQLLDRYPRQLSGGQRQRVAMGRAIVRDPQVFLFDEPLSNLDAKLRVQMRTEIKELHQRLKTTSVYVTHDQIEAMTMADQIVVMRDGRWSSAASAGPLRPSGQPVRGRLHRLAGDELHPGHAAQERRRGRGRVRRRHPRAGPYGSALQGSDGQKVTYGVRPEHLSIGGAGQGIATKVIVVEPTGADTEVFSRFGETSLTSIFRERHDFGAGDLIHLVPDHARTHLFDAESGKSLAAR
jgi:multiple sugar transport system ATP-binding protein